MSTLNKIFIVFIFSILNLSANKLLIETNGVLINSEKIINGVEQGFDFGSGLIIINKDDSIYGIFSGAEVSEEFYFIRNKQKLIPKIRAFYPTYDLFIMDANKETDTKYKVKIDGKWKYVNNLSTVTYKTWKNFLIEDCSFIALKGNELQIFSSLHDSKGIRLKNSNDYAFKIKKVEGDFVYAECDIDCEGCPSNKVIKGWFRWREGKQLLLDLRYIC